MLIAFQVLLFIPILTFYAPGSKPELTKAVPGLMNAVFKLTKNDSYTDSFFLQV
jgi:hypothetical protein